MGDRGNIKVYEDGTRTAAVWMYTHWHGSEIAEVVSAALSNNQRWEDGQYLSRIIFDALTGCGGDPFTGYGLTTRLCDNEKLVIGVDPEAQQITIETEPGRVIAELPFSDHTALPALFKRHNADKPADWRVR